MMPFICLLIEQSILIIHHRHFRSQISTIGLYHCIRNDQISKKQVWNHPNRTSDGYDLIKTILAWWAAQIQSKIRLHVDSAAQNLLPRLGSQNGSAQLSSARGWWRGRWVPLCWRGCWLVADLACWLCMMTSSLHHADVIMGHAYCAWWRHILRHDDVILSGSATWVGSTGIWVGSAHPGEEDTWHTWGAWADALPERDGSCGQIRRPILTPFSPVASSLPPLHSGMFKT